MFAVLDPLILFFDFSIFVLDTFDLSPLLFFLLLHIPTGLFSRPLFSDLLTEVLRLSFGYSPGGPCRFIPVSFVLLLVFCAPLAIFRSPPFIPDASIYH